MWPQILRGALGAAMLVFIAWLLSSNRRAFPWRTVLGGLALQCLLALFVLRTDLGRDLLTFVASIVTAIIDATNRGAGFVLGRLVEPDGPWGWLFVTRAIPPIIVFSSLSAIGYHLGVLQAVVSFMARIMVRALGVSGAEGLSAAGNVFLGQTEAPLLVRPYIPKMTDSELMALMTGGFATIASGVMAAYVAMVGGEDPERQVAVARHFLTACLMSAPASFVFAKVMLPETQTPATRGRVHVGIEKKTRNVIHAAAIGASDGARLAFNVAAMLIAFIAILAILDALLGWIAGFTWLSGPLAYLGYPPGDVGWLQGLYAGRDWVFERLGFARLDIANILGLLYAPVAYLIGVEWAECRQFGELLGKAMSANEFLAYQRLAELRMSGVLSERSILLATYSLCGFANFSSIAIQIGGIGSIAPERKADLARLGLRAMFGGAMACWLTGCIAGILV